MIATSSSFLDTLIARIMALMLSLLIFLFMIIVWSNDFRAILSSAETLPVPIQSNSKAAQNPALEACLNKRVGDVMRMKEEGVISDSQFEAYRSRAMTLCHGQHPS